jgi:hypothetical protein
MPLETRDARAAKGGFPLTPPPAPGEQGRRQVGSSPCLCPTNTQRASSEAASTISPPRGCGGRVGVGAPPRWRHTIAMDIILGLRHPPPPPLQSTIAQIAAVVHGRMRIAKQRDPPALGQRSRPRHWYLPPRLRVATLDFAPPLLIRVERRWRRVKQRWRRVKRQRRCRRLRRYCPPKRMRRWSLKALLHLHPTPLSMMEVRRPRVAHTMMPWMIFVSSRVVGAN